jgi:lysophospholipase L1-like esterase
MKKLVLFGDSLFAQAGKERVLLFERALGDYDVYNCAAGGWDTNDCVRKSPYISKLEADVVVISLGTNDASPWKQVPLATFTDNLPKIFSNFSKSRIVYFLPPPVNEEKLPESKKSLTNEVLEKYIEGIRQVCAKSGVDVLDSWKIFKPMLLNGEDYHVEDGVHLTDLAYEKIADEVSRILKD